MALLATLLISANAKISNSQHRLDVLDHEGNNQHAKEHALVRREQNVTARSGTYIQSSHMFFCICRKCGTTSLFRYMFGATHHETWCEYATKQWGPQEGCSSSEPHLFMSLRVSPSHSAPTRAPQRRPHLARA